METLTTARLVLEPLRVAHADAMFPLLSDPSLYRFLDHPPPPSLAHCSSVYARLEARMSPDGTQRWLNRIVVPHGGEPIGFVQATVVDGQQAWLAWLLGAAHTGRGFATEAVRAMRAHLVERYDVRRFVATVEADHAKSIALTQRVGMRPATVAESTGIALDPSERLFVG